ncbi:MAG: hypothetical protein QM731_28610 [Chitinophagaceae bacterium]
MKSRKPADMSNEELLKNEKMLKGVTYSLCGLLILLLGLTIYLTIKKGFTALCVVPLGLSTIVILNFNTLKEIEKEKRSRNLS